MSSLDTLGYNPDQWKELSKREILRQLEQAVLVPGGFEKMIKAYPKIIENPKKGETFLTGAAQMGLVEVVKVLMQHINPKTKMRTGDTALTLAASSYIKDDKKVEVIKVLLPVSSPLNKDQHDKNAFMKAAEAGSFEAMKLLYSLKSFKLRDFEGNSALMLAAKGGHMECVLWLMEKSDPKEKNHNEWTASDVAEVNEKEACAQMLKAWELASSEQEILKRATETAQTSAAGISSEAKAKPSVKRVRKLSL